MEVVNNAAARGITLTAQAAVVVVAVRAAGIVVPSFSSECLRGLLVLSEIIWLYLTWCIGSGLHERLLRAGSNRRVREHGFLQGLVVSLEQPHVRLRRQT